MEDLLETVLDERLDFVERVKCVFLDLKLDTSQKLRRGKVQEEILKRLHAPATGFNKRTISEALGELGFKKVKVRGFLYYRKVSGEKKCA
jgi:hypothetical protein